jgi:hypothetical protein
MTFQFPLITTATVKPMWLCSALQRSWYLQRSSLGFTGIAFGQTATNQLLPIMTETVKPMLLFTETERGISREANLDLPVLLLETVQTSRFGRLRRRWKGRRCRFQTVEWNVVSAKKPTRIYGYNLWIGTDLPVAADYDGDGKADVAVFRNGTWYIQRSQAGFTSIAFGIVNDKPIPNAFVQ